MLQTSGVLHFPKLETAGAIHSGLKLENSCNQVATLRCEWCSLHAVPLSECRSI